MPYTTLVPGTTITASWANANVRDQVITPFASAAARASAITSPIEGMYTDLADTDVLDRHDGSSWVPGTARRMGSVGWTSQTAGTSETLVTGSAITFTAIAGRRYEFHLTGHANSNTAGDNVGIRIRYKAGATVDTGGTLVRECVYTIPANNIVIPVAIDDEITGIAAGQTTIGVFVFRYGGSGSTAFGNAVSSRNFFKVTDIGT